MFSKRKCIVITRTLVLLAIVISIFSTTSVLASGAKEKIFLTLPTASVGGSYFPAGTILASLWNEKLKEEYNIYATSQSSKGSRENIQMLRNREAELAILNSSVYAPAFFGTGAFENDSFQDLRLITLLWANPMQMVVTEKSGIDELSDIRGQRVSVGAAGGGTVPQTKIMFYGANMTLDDVKAEYLGYNQSVQAMKDGKIKAAQMSGALPLPGILDLFSSPIKIKLISLRDEEIVRITREYPNISKFTIPAETYPNQDYEVKTVATTTVIGIHKDIDDGIVYLLTKTIFENLDYLSKGYKALSRISLETAFDGLKVPLHPGAIRYYKEVGLEIPESLMFE